MGRQLTHLQQDAEALTQPSCNELSSWEVLVSICPPPPKQPTPLKEDVALQQPPISKRLRQETGIAPSSSPADRLINGEPAVKLALPISCF